MITFGQLKTEVRGLAWPEGEASNLEAVHDKFFIEALWDLQNRVECLTQNNTFQFPACASYFQCGMTVLPKPEAEILSVFSIDKINPETGAEDSEADDDWCQKVYYKQVDYCHIQQYAKICQCCSTTSEAVADALLTTLFGIYRYKRCYPAPTDEGLAALPRLPQGFHYPQESTDSSGRSPKGVWAIYRGRIYVAPWIQSTETLVIEGNGIKRTWLDSDLVDDDPKFKQAVRLLVAIQHYESFEENQTKLTEFKGTLYGDQFQFGVLPELIKRCRDENRLHLCNEMGSKGSAARGLGSSTAASNLFYNERREYTASCPSGQTGASITAVVDAGTVGSALSVEDANAKASQQAQDDANARLVCVTPAVTYYNTAQTYTANCPGASGATPAATGSPVTVTIAANQYSSTVSQAAADALALAAAANEAGSQLTCTFYNAAQSFTASCPDGTDGDDVTVTIPAGDSRFNSTISQADANSKASAAAQNQANADLDCEDDGAGDTIIVGNSPQVRTVTAACVCPANLGRSTIITRTIGVAVNTFTQATTQAEAAATALALNQQAANLAQQQAQQLWDAACAQFQNSFQCRQTGTSG